jgi:hypothetical protein
MFEDLSLMQDSLVRTIFHEDSFMKTFLIFFDRNDELILQEIEEENF